MYRTYNPSAPGMHNMGGGSDSHTRVSYKDKPGFFGQIQQSFCASLFGILLVIASFPVIYLNEGRAVQTGLSLDEGLRQVVPLQYIDQISAENDNRLVHLTGSLHTDRALVDKEYNIAVRAVKLRRTVEMYQWVEHKKTREYDEGGKTRRETTFSYSMEWKDHIVRSDGFDNPSGHQNPNSMPVESYTREADVVKVGAFSLSKDTLLGSTRRNLFFDKKRNEYFFDRDPDIFTYIIQFYRKGIVHFPEHECACCFKAELDFFGIVRNHLGDCCYELFQEKHDEFVDYQKRHAKPDDADQFVPRTLREKMWKLFEDPEQNMLGLLMHYVSAVLILISVVASTTETLKCGGVTCGDKYSGPFYIVESICVTVLTVEYLARLYAAPSRYQFMKQFLSVIDVVAIIPFYVALAFPDAADGPFTVLRVSRTFRIVKMSRHNTKVREAGSSLLASLSELSFVFVVLTTLVILFSTIIYYAEMGDENTAFTSIPATFWYVIVTMTTLGYGDMTPFSLVGRLTGIICSLSGIMVVALSAPILEKNFNRKKEEGRPDHDHVKKHNHSKPSNSVSTPK